MLSLLPNGANFLLKSLEVFVSLHYSTDILYKEEIFMENCLCIYPH